MKSLRVRRLFEAHVHFRQDALLPYLVRETAAYCSYAVPMGNTIPPVVTPEDANYYVELINQAIPTSSSMRAVKTAMLTERTTPQMVRDLAKAGVRMIKTMFKGTTNNAHVAGIPYDRVFDFYPHYKAMADCGIIRSMHVEDPTCELPWLREEKALPVFQRLVDDFPGAPTIMEHISTWQAAAYVEKAPAYVAGTITAHHPVLLAQDWAGKNGMIYPHNWCLPPAKSREDRKAIRLMMHSGNPKFFFGSDTAPHKKEEQLREMGACCGGVFTATYLPCYLAQVFDEEGALDKLQDFTSTFACQFYGEPIVDEYIELIRAPVQVVRQVDFGDIPIMPFMAGETLAWSWRAVE